MELIFDTSHDLFSKTLNGKYPIFFTSEYAKFLKLQNQSLALVYNSELEAMIPIKIWKSKLLRYITCLYRPLCDKGNLSLKEEELFLNVLVQFIKTKNLADRISAPENFALFQTVPKFSAHAAYGTYLLDLYPNDYSTIFSKFQARYRSAIKNAEKNGIEIRYGKDCIHDFYQLHKETMLRSNMHVHPISYFENYFSAMFENCHLAVAYFRNEAIGALFNLYNDYSSFYLYGCSSKSTFASGAIKYLQANAMQIMIDKKVRQYDFVGARLSDVSGSKLQGIQDFKSRFGTRLENAYIWKYDIHPLKCKMADWMLYFKLKFLNIPKQHDIIDQERIKC